MSKGIVLVVAGVWIILQVVKGGLLDHLGL
jgi:hypothetical protein